MSQLDTINNWRRNQLHLPAFMRSDENQDALFEWMQVAVENQAKKYGHALLPDLRQAHCYTIDIFLWRMAAMGYTLQRTKFCYPFMSEADVLAQGRAIRERRRDAFIDAVLGESSRVKLQQQCDTTDLDNHESESSNTQQHNAE